MVLLPVHTVPLLRADSSSKSSLATKHQHCEDQTEAAISREQVMKLLHRFYEPLVLLHVLDPTQGDHVREEADRLPLDITSSRELRRRFVSALAYICDFKKGGDSFTAIFVTQSPLIYYIACNKGPRPETLSFLQETLDHLEKVYDLNEEQRAKAKGKILAECVKFSNKRLKAYWDFLRNALVRCEEILRHGPGSQGESTTCISRHQHSFSFYAHELTQQFSHLCFETRVNRLQSEFVGSMPSLLRAVEISRFEFRTGESLPRRCSEQQAKQLRGSQAFYWSSGLPCQGDRCPHGCSRKAAESLSGSSD